MKHLLVQWQKSGGKDGGTLSAPPLVSLSLLRTLELVSLPASLFGRPAIVISFAQLSERTRARQNKLFIPVNIEIFKLNGTHPAGAQ